MKILQIHNSYQYAGGEDVVVKAEGDVLQNNNNTVISYKRHNDEIKDYSIVEKAGLLWKTSWSKKSYTEIKSLIKEHSPDICHVHNFFPLITPSVYYACTEEKIPVVQTLHNYRLICANGLFFRDGRICENCLHDSSINAIIHACYRNSRIQSTAVVTMNELHRASNTWKDKVDSYICLTGFAKKKFTQAGFPEEKIFVKQNFLQYDPGFSATHEKFFLFVGRLDSYKGIDLLLKIAPTIATYGYRIVVAGDGPEKSLVENNSALEYVGRKSPEDIVKLMRKSTALIFPSLLYEGMPMTIIEAFACGKPVIASRLGGPSEMIEDGVTGLLFNPGDSIDLMQKLLWIVSHPEQVSSMSLNARKDFEMKYTAEHNYRLLIDIYQKTIDKKKENIKLKPQLIS